MGKQHFAGNSAEPFWDGSAMGFFIFNCRKPAEAIWFLVRK